MMIAITSLAIALALGALIGWGVGYDALPLPRAGRLAIVTLPLLLLAVWMTWANALEIERGIARRAWPTTQATVESAYVVEVGRRNFMPEILYRYTVDGAAHQASSHLATPGFGLGSSREEVARAIVAENPVGSSFTVHYDPADPAVSYPKPGPRWEHFTRFSLGVILAGIAALLQATRSLARPAPPADPDPAAASAA